MFNQFIKGERKKEKEEAKKFAEDSDNFIKEYEELCQKHKCQVVGKLSYGDNGIGIVLKTTRIKELPDAPKELTEESEEKEEKQDA